MKKIKINKKRLIIAILIIVLIVALIFGTKLTKILKLKHYENKMNEYDISSLYNNGSPNSEENVSMSEAVKLILSTNLKTKDILTYIDKFDEVPYDNYEWVYYAQRYKIIEFEFINQENEKEPIKIIDALKILYNSREKSGYEIEDKNIGEIKIKNKDQYSEEEIKYIEYFIKKGVLENNYNYTKDTTVTKEMFNKLIVNYVEIFELISK